MQNRFGLKDFVILVAVGVVGVLVLLSMKQKDRDRDVNQQMVAKISDLERALLQLDAKLESGLVVAGSAPAGTTAAPARDESWARPGVEVEWQPAWRPATDARNSPLYRTGGSFTEIFEAQPAKLTPYIQTDVYGRRVIDVVMEPLGAYDPKTLRLRGVLADAWQMDPKGLWLRVKIRDEARYSDGVAVSAEDVRWTFHEFIMNPQIEAQRVRSTMADAIEKVEVVTEKVVEFTFKQALFNNLDQALTIWPLPRHFYDLERIPPSEVNKSTGLLMGSGPFKLKTLDIDSQWKPGEIVEVVRNEQYWGNKPALETIRFQAIQDELPRLTSYKNGDAEMITPAAPQFATLQKDPEWVKENHNLNWVCMRSGNSFIAWNCGERKGKLTPFHDRRVRVAMTHLLNREKMIRDIWAGIGVVSKGSFIPTSPGSNPTLAPYPFDLAKGQALLKEAGWEDRDRNGVLEDKDGREFEFEFTYTTSGEISQKIALFVQDSFKQAGIRVTLRGVDWSVSDPIRKQRDFDAITMGWSANAPESDPKQIFHSNSIKDQGDNFAQWNNPEADRLIDLGRSTIDLDERIKVWHEFERVMHEDQPYTWVRVQPWVRFVKGYIGNVNAYPKGLEPWEFFNTGGASALAPAN
jgi:peptide/nickel transport system substrate-binding protein